MIYDPFQTHKTGLITADLMAAQNALEEAHRAAISLVPDSDYREGIVGAIGSALNAVREARKIDLWELARPEAAALEGQHER